MEHLSHFTFDKYKRDQHYENGNDIAEKEQRVIVANIGLVL